MRRVQTLQEVITNYQQRRREIEGVNHGMEVANCFDEREFE